MFEGSFKNYVMLRGLSEKDDVAWLSDKFRGGGGHQKKWRKRTIWGVGGGWHIREPSHWVFKKYDTLHMYEKHIFTNKNFTHEKRFFFKTSYIDFFFLFRINKKTYNKYWFNYSTHQRHINSIFKSKFFLIFGAILDSKKTLLAVAVLLM